MTLRHHISISIITLLTSLISPEIFAQPLLTTSNLNTLGAFCEGNSPGLPAHSGNTKIMFMGADGNIPALQDTLPNNIRADDFSSTGIVMCLEVLEVELETCNFGILFNIPRVRLDYILNAYSMANPLDSSIQTIVSGGDAPACNEVGIIDNSVSRIAGDEPELTALLSKFNELQLNTLDNDDDGYSNISEFVRASDPEDNTSPGTSISILINDTTDIELPEGEAFTVNISLNPGQLKGEISDYYLYADSLSGIFSYIYPKVFKETASQQIAITGPALRFNDIDLITLPGMGVGEYEMHFEVEIGNQATLSSSANLSIIPNTWQFTEISEQAGFNYSHGYAPTPPDVYQNRDLQISAAGVAAGDYDNDGWIDLYVTRGTIGPNLLYKNLGNGSFAEVGANAGVAIQESNNTGAVFADYDGDGWLDLFVGGANDTQPTLFHNSGDGSFEDVTASSGLTEMLISFGGSYADIDKDGDLDLWINHWLWNQWGAFLWENNGDGTFSDITVAAGIPNNFAADNATNFADFNNDGWPDILISGDYGTSQILLNNQDGTFTVTTTDVISDENGMGGAVADYDNDGDLDWFVSSVYDVLGQQEGVNWGATGNRLYQNQGDGSVIDVTEESGMRIGYWGWGSCFADFNNDAHLDLFHVNGWTADGFNAALQFDKDPSRLFISDQQGAFIERSSELGLQDNNQGRGIVCFDFDRDGDVDIFTANSEQAPALFRNDGGNLNNYLHIQVEGEQKNTEAIGARVYVTINDTIQMRELQVSNNFMSQNPVEVYFGLGNADNVDQVRVVWPSGQERTLENVSINQLLFVQHPLN